MCVSNVCTKQTYKPTKTAKDLHSNTMTLKIRPMLATLPSAKLFYGAWFSVCSLPVALCLTSGLAHTERMGRDTNKVYLLKTCQGDAKSSPGKPSWPSKQSNTMQRGLPTPLKRACPHSVFLVSVGVMNELPVQLLRLPNKKRDMPTDHTFVAICSFSRHCHGQ